MPLFSAMSALGKQIIYVAPAMPDAVVAEPVTSSMPPLRGLNTLAPLTAARMPDAGRALAPIQAPRTIFSVQSDASAGLLQAREVARNDQP